MPNITLVLFNFVSRFPNNNKLCKFNWGWDIDTTTIFFKNITKMPETIPEIIKNYWYAKVCQYYILAIKPSLNNQIIEFRDLGLLCNILVVIMNLG